MFSLNGTFKEGEGDGEKAWGQEKGKTKGKHGETSSGKTDEETIEHGERGAVGGHGEAEGNDGNNPQRNWQLGSDDKDSKYSNSCEEHSRSDHHIPLHTGDCREEEYKKDTNLLSFEDKVKHLKDQFETIPRVLIKQVLQRGDVEGNIHTATNCLNNMQFREGSTHIGLEGNTSRTPESSKREKQNPPKVPKKPQKKRNGYEGNKNSGKPGNESKSLMGERKLFIGNLNKLKTDEERSEHGESGAVGGRGAAEGNDGNKNSGKSGNESKSLMGERKLFIGSLNKSTSVDTIRNFIESKTQEQVLQIDKLDKTSALVTLQKIEDFEKLKRNLESRTLDGAKVKIERVPAVSILVRNISSDTTRDTLQYYFSNSRIGGEVTSIQYEKGSSQAVVTFKDLDVMQKVLSSKSLNLDEANLTVERFNPTLQKHSQGLHSKEEIAVAVDKDMMEFTTTTHSLHESLNVLGFSVKYTSGDSIVYIVPIISGENQVKKERGIKAVIDFTKKFQVIELDVEKDHWLAVMSEIWKLHKDIGKDRVSVKEAEFSKEKITIICPISEAQHIKRKFSEKIAETQSLEVKKTYEKETISIEKERLAFMNQIGFKENQLPEYDELEVDIDQDNGTITIIGPKEQFSEAKIKIYQYLANMSGRTIALSQTVYEMLSTEEGLERIKTELRRKNLDAVFCINEGNKETNTVVGINKKCAVEAAALIKSLTSEIKIKVEKDMMEVLRTQKWRDLCDEVRQHFNVYVRINEYSDTWIAGFKGDVSSAHDRIQTFLNDYTIGTDTKVPHVTETMEDRADEFNKKKTYYSGHIIADKEEDKLIVGTMVECAGVQNPLPNLEDFVAKEQNAIQQPVLHKYDTNGACQCVRCLIKKLEKERQSIGSSYRVLQYKDKSLTEKTSSNDAAAQATHPSKSASTDPKSMKCGNVTISWKQGNIVTENVDILVGLRIGKLSQMFIEAAGGTNLQRCITKLDTSFTTTETGNLPCNEVILVSCPKWDGEKGVAETKLRFLVKVCLQRASKNNASSIAFPIIGTGERGFPDNTACKIMINEVINVISGWGTSSLNDIRFVVFAQDTQLINAFQQEFNLASGSTSAHASKGGGLCQPLYSVHSSTTANVFGNVSVQVLQRDLVQEQTHAIVNINGTDMNMQNAGALSKYVDTAAGPSVQEECTMLGKQKRKGLKSILRNRTRFLRGKTE